MLAWPLRHDGVDSAPAAWSGCGMLQRCYSLSPRSRLERSGGADRLRCDHPLQSIALNESARRLLGALRPGVPLEAVAAGVTAQTVEFLDGLALGGALRADYRLLPAHELAAFDVVIPAYGPLATVGRDLRRCLAALAAQRYPLERVRVTLVDDASPEPLQVALGEPPPGLRLRWLRLSRNAGPASARNAGVAAPWQDSPVDDPRQPVSAEQPAPWLAFVDSDCVPQPDWLAGLAALLEDPHVAAAGGAVRGLAQAGLLARYEHARSSLHLGERPGPVGLAEGAPAYLPSCNLGVRRSVYEAVGGFREGWRFGEDVDLCWRLRAAGHGLFYHPAAAVAHAHRTRWGPFLQRRRAYGRSEAALRKAHPQRFEPLLRPGPALVLGGCALGLASGGAGAAVGALLALLALLGLAARPWLRNRRRALVDPGDPGWPLRALLAAGLRRTAARLVLQAQALNRQAALPGLLAAALLPALWPLAAAVFAAGALGEWRARRPGPDLGRLGVGIFAVGYAAECLAYSLGRLEGALALRLRTLWERGRRRPRGGPGPRGG